MEQPEKPTQKAIARYKETIETYLSNYNVKVEPEVLGQVSKFFTYEDGKEVPILYSWMYRVNVTSDEIGKLRVFLNLRNTIREDEPLALIWYDARQIQLEIHRTLKKPLPDPNPLFDPALLATLSQS